MDIQGTVRDILQDKGDQVWTTREDATVYEAVGLMGKHNIGALVVLNAHGKVTPRCPKSSTSPQSPSA